MTDSKFKPIPLLSTGDTATLGTYRNYAGMFGEEAQQFLDHLIERADEGEDALVLIPEEQMMRTLSTFLKPGRIVGLPSFSEVTGDSRSKTKEH